MFFMFIPSLGNIPVLTDILQMSWNHQPDMYIYISLYYFIAIASSFEVGITLFSEVMQISVVVGVFQSHPMDMQIDLRWWTTMVARCLNKLLMDIQVGMMGQMGVSLHSFWKIFFPHRLGSMEQEKQMRTNIGVHMCIVILHFKACSGPQSSDQWISKTCCRLVLLYQWVTRYKRW